MYGWMCLIYLVYVFMRSAAAFAASTFCFLHFGVPKHVHVHDGHTKASKSWFAIASSSFASTSPTRYCSNSSTATFLSWSRRNTRRRGKQRIMDWRGGGGDEKLRFFCRCIFFINSHFGSWPQTKICIFFFFQRIENIEVPENSRNDRLLLDLSQ